MALPMHAFESIPLVKSHSRESSIHGIVHERLIAHAVRYRSVPFVGNGMKWNRTGNSFLTCTV